MSFLDEEAAKAAQRLFEQDPNNQNGADQPNGATPRVSPLPLPPWPVALSTAAYHGIIGQIVQLIEPETEADPASLLFHLLAFCGNCMGNEAWFEVEATHHYPNLFAVIVGDTSKARKGTAERWIRRLLREAAPGWEANCTANGLSTGEGLIYRVRDQTVEYKTDKGGHSTIEVIDPGVSDKRLLVVEQEFARILRVMGRKDNTLSMVLREAWDAMNRLSTLTKKNPTIATGALISLVAHITMTELQKELSETETANGFGNRLLFACSRRSKLLPLGGNIPAAALAMLAQQLKQILAQSPKGKITFDDPAEQRWRQIYSDLSKSGTRLFDAMTARSEAQTLRVALIYALLDGQQQIGLAHLEAANEVIRYSNDSVRHIFGDATGNRTADTIIHALRANPEGMTRTNISNDLFGRNTPSDEIGRALALLLEHGMVHCERIPAPTGRGRPVELWTAN